MVRISGRFNEENPVNKINLDKKDIQILTMLSKDARTPLSKIAKAVKLSRDSVNYRLRRMEEKKFLLLYSPIINLKAFGFNSYHFFLIIKEGKKEA